MFSALLIDWATEARGAEISDAQLMEEISEMGIGREQAKSLLEEIYPDRAGTIMEKMFPQEDLGPNLG